jgi:Zn-dependent peptidase ImmA (M78 family)
METLGNKPQVESRAPAVDYTSFITNKVSALLSKYIADNGSLSPPMDLHRLAPFCQVQEIVECPMISEGVLTPVSGGFKIYLQNNFANMPGALSRSRFTLAHELIHTFFYDSATLTPTLRADTPGEPDLERLCHSGAAAILIPETALKTEARALGSTSTAEHITILSDKFLTSPETMMRRVQQLDLADSESYAVLLVNTTARESKITAVCFRAWLRACSPTLPRIGMNFDRWVASLLPPNTAMGFDWTHTLPRWKLDVRKVARPSVSASHFVELRRSG